MEIKISLEPINKELFEELDKQLNKVYQKLNELQKISVKKQILGLKDKQYALEAEIIQLTNALVMETSVEEQEPVRKFKKPVVNEPVEEVSDENTETIDL